MRSIANKKINTTTTPQTAGAATAAVRAVLGLLDAAQGGDAAGLPQEVLTEEQAT